MRKGGRGQFEKRLRRGVQTGRIQTRDVLVPLQRRQFGPGDDGAVVPLLLVILLTMSVVVVSVIDVLVVVGVPVHVIVMASCGHHVCVHGIVVAVFVQQHATTRPRVEDQRRKAREEQEHADET